MNARQYALSIYRQAALKAKGERTTETEKQESRDLEAAMNAYEARQENKASNVLNNFMGA